MMPIASPAPDGPCLCGSDRTFSVCCASRFATDIAVWQRAREAECRLVTQIAAYGLRTWGPALFKDALHFFCIGPRSSASLQSLLPVFDAWYAFTWTPRFDECDLTPESWPTVPLGVAWLTTGPAAVGDFDHQFILTAAVSPYSLFLVEAVRPGWSLTILDLLTGRRFVAIDPEVSAHVRRDDILMSAVLTVDGVSVLLATGPRTLPSEWRIEAAELRRAYSHRPWQTREELLGLEGELFSEYRNAFDRGPASLLRDESRAPLHLEWLLSNDFEDTLERLRPLSECYGEEYIDLATTPDGQPSAFLTWYEPGPSGDSDDWVSLGYLYVQPARLTADVPTQMGARRLSSEIGARFDDAVPSSTRSAMPVVAHPRQSSLVVL